MARNLAIFGGSFNPPGIHHREVAAQLAPHFDELRVVPCGPRPDKMITNDVEPVYRAAMCDMNFAGLAKVHVDLFDLEANTFTRTHDLQDRFHGGGTVWHVAGADLMAGGAQGQSVVQREWARGEELWAHSHWAIVKRPGYELAPGDLPPNSRVFESEHLGASTSIRQKVFQHEPYEHLVLPRIARFIERHGLYRGHAPNRRTSFIVESPRVMTYADERNPRAVEIAAALGAHDTTDPDVIVVVGGDGTMLRAIRQHWRRRVPFYGINTGHVGFLLNDHGPDPLANGPPFSSKPTELLAQHLPLLWVETLDRTGEHRAALAFNDAWVERATGQTAWIRVVVNGQERIAQLVADGALVATAAGSASYARAMGATPVPLGTPALLLVGSNVLSPDGWRPVVLPWDSELELTTLDPEKRPLRGYVDGVSHGEVSSMRVRTSRIAAVELAFDPQHDPAEKLARIQFPR